MRAGRRLVCLLLWVLVAGALPAGAAGKQYALVVGIDRYESPAVTPLRFAVRDARVLAQTLRAAGFEKVFEMTTDDAKSDSYASRTNIIFRLEWLRDRLRADDSLVFYFSGHGIETDGRTFLLTKESDPRSLGTLKQSACHAADVREVLDQMKAGRILVIYDACRANPKADKGAEDNRLSSQAARDLIMVQKKDPGGSVPRDRVLATLLSCSKGERSYEWNEKQHGYFTYHLVEGLKGAAADKGRVSLASLMRYVNAQVRRATDEAGYKQQPWSEISGTSLDSWVLTRGKLQVAALPASSEERPPPLQQTTPSVPTDPEPAPLRPSEPTPPPKKPARAGIDSRWFGTWSIVLQINGVPQMFESENRRDGTFTHYWIGPGGRQFVRSGKVEQFQDGRFRTAVGAGDMAGQVDTGTYTWGSSDSVTTYGGAGIFTWTRKR